MFIIIAFIISVFIIWLFYRKTQPEISNRKRYFLVSLRFCSVFILLLILLNPIFYYSKKEIHKPCILVLNDNSLSMKEGTKQSALSGIKNNLVSSFNKEGYQINEFNFANGLYGNNQSTFLTQTLIDLTNKNQLDNVKYIILNSDGWLHDSDLSFATNLNIPFITLQVPSKQIDTDLSIDAVYVNDKNYTNEVSSITVDCTAKSYSGKASVDLLVAGKKVAEKAIDFSSNSYLQVIFENTFKQTGLYPITVKIHTQNKEINYANNEYPSAIDITANKNRILIISDRMNWDAKFIHDVIKLNPHWQKRFLLSKGNTLYSGNQAFDPTTELYAVIILINTGNLYLNPSLSQFIAHLTEKGTGLLIMGKPIYSLNSIAPFQLSNITNSYKASFTLTTQSKEYQTFESLSQSLDNIPPVDYFYVKPLSTTKILAVFANSSQSPAIAYQELNNGKIIQLSFLNLWKWQLWEEKSTYQGFIDNLLTWLSNPVSNRLYVTTSKLSYFQGENVLFKAKAFDERMNEVRNINLQLSLFDDKNNIVAHEYFIRKNDDYLSEIHNLKPGNYHFSAKDPALKQHAEGKFLVSTYNQEKRDWGYNTPLLSFFAKVTSGSFVTDSSSLQYIANKAEANTDIIKNEIPIYKNWTIITLFLVSFCLELYLRKRWGLL